MNTSNNAFNRILRELLDPTLAVAITFLIIFLAGVILGHLIG